MPPRSPQIRATAGQTCFRLGLSINGNDYLGDDPDPFIRFQIQRDLGAHYGGEN